MHQLQPTPTHPPDTRPPATNGQTCHWDHLPPEHKHEMIMTLTAILVKRLSRLHRMPEETDRE